MGAIKDMAMLKEKLADAGYSLARGVLGWDIRETRRHKYVHVRLAGVRGEKEARSEDFGISTVASWWDYGGALAYQKELNEAVEALRWIDLLGKET
jgi:hypothetical protein